MQRPVPPRVARIPRPVHARPRRIPEPAPGASRLRATGALVVLTVAVTILLHGLSLASGPGAGPRTLRAVVPVLTDVDQALAAHEQAVQATASLSGGTVRIPGLPLTVEVPRAAAEAGGADLRQATVNAAARRLYLEGPLAFRAPDARSGDTRAWFTSQWALRGAIDVLTRGAHEWFSRARSAAGVLAALALALMIVQLDSRQRLAGVGSAVLVGAMLAGFVLVLARVGVWLTVPGGSHAVEGAVVERVARDVVFTTGLVAVIAAGAGTLLMATGAMATRRLAASQRRMPHPERLAREPWEDV